MAQEMGMNDRGRGEGHDTVTCRVGAYKRQVLFMSDVLPQPELQALGS